MAKKKEAGPSHSEIAEAAYLRYLSRGSHGSDLDDWVEAERELRSRSGPKTPAKPTTPRPKPKS